MLVFLLPFSLRAHLCEWAAATPLPRGFCSTPPSHECQADQQPHWGCQGSLAAVALGGGMTPHKPCGCHLKLHQNTWQSSGWGQNGRENDCRHSYILPDLLGSAYCERGHWVDVSPHTCVGKEAMSRALEDSRGQKFYISHEPEAVTHI